MVKSIIRSWWTRRFRTRSFARNIMGGKESAERISKAYKRLNKKISCIDKIVNSTQSYRGVLTLLNRFNSNRTTHDTD